MRALLAALCLLPLAMSLRAAPPNDAQTAPLAPAPSAAPQTDWADCAACHPDANADLPRLAQLRPPSGVSLLADSCFSCHKPIELEGTHRDWRHPVRPIGSHIPCGSCHPGVAHSAGAPPPLPKGGYKEEGCFECHRGVELDLNCFFSHGRDPRVTCRDCHPPHEPLAAQLPSPLLPAGEAERWLASYDWYASAEGCLRCHPPAQLLLETREGFVTLNTVNYHDVHVMRGRVLCIECHNPHGSNRRGMLRGSLLTGETLSYFERMDGGSCSVTCHGIVHDSWQYTNRMF